MVTNWKGCSLIIIVIIIVTLISILDCRYTSILLHRPDFLSLYYTTIYIHFNNSLSLSLSLSLPLEEPLSATMAKNPVTVLVTGAAGTVLFSLHYFIFNIVCPFGRCMGKWQNFIIFNLIRSLLFIMNIIIQKTRLTSFQLILAQSFSLIEVVRSGLFIRWKSQNINHFFFLQFSLKVIS
jgi:hypothetical protein